jgi:hypothetical protein
MRRGTRLTRSPASKLSKRRNPLSEQKRRNRQRRHVLYTIHVEAA